MLADPGPVPDESVLHELAEPRGLGAQSRHPVNHVLHEVEAVHLVHHHHVERGGGGAFLLVAADVDVVVAVAAVGEPVDQPRIPVVGEDDRPSGGEQRVELGVAHAVRVLSFRLEPHQVHHVDDPDPQFRQVLTEDVGGGEDFQGGDVTRAAEHHVRLGAVGVGAGPFPDPGAAGAVEHGGVHVQPVRGRLLAGDDHVDVVAAAQAMVGDRQEGVGVRRQVDPDHFRLLVHHVVDEARVLV